MHDSLFSAQSTPSHSPPSALYRSTHEAIEIKKGRPQSYISSCDLVRHCFAMPFADTFYIIHQIDGDETRKKQSRLVHCHNRSLTTPELKKVLLATRPANCETLAALLPLRTSPPARSSSHTGGITIPQTEEKWRGWLVTCTESSH